MTKFSTLKKNKNKLVIGKTAPQSESYIDPFYIKFYTHGEALKFAAVKYNQDASTVLELIHE